MRQPALFYQKPATLHANATRCAALLHISREQFNESALKHPPLFSLKPETVCANVARSAELLGVAREQFVAAALCQPPLFSLRPEGLKRKQFYLLKISEALASNNKMSINISGALIALCYGARRLHARFIIAKLGLMSTTLSGLLVLPAREADAIIHRHFTAQMQATGRGFRALQVMHASGLIQTLPPGVKPLGPSSCGTRSVKSGTASQL
jgi:hypothetical protein